jgi:hypothetical protein
MCGFPTMRRLGRVATITIVVVITTAAPRDGSEPVAFARLREQLAERDEIIVALQHVIRDLRHEIDNLSAERAYATLAHLPPRRASSR